MTSFMWTAFTFLGGLLMIALGDMVSEEVRDRLDHLPHAILLLAARRLDPAQRFTVYEDEWLPELTYILKGDEARPMTRLYHGTRFALGILVRANRITRQLDRPISAGSSESRAFEIIVPRVLVDENVQLADLNRIIHGFEEVDPKTALLATVDRSMIHGRIHADALARQASESKSASRRQRREMVKHQEQARHMLMMFNQIRVDIEAHYETRLGKGEHVE